MWRAQVQFATYTVHVQCTFIVKISIIYNKIWFRESLNFIFLPVQPEVVPYNFTELGAFDDRDLGALIVQNNATIVNFFVDVRADPCPNINWFFNGTQFGPSDETFMYSNPCIAADARSPNWRFTLTVPLLTEDTSGSYTASFTNIAGTTKLPTPVYFTIPGRCSIYTLSFSLLIISLPASLHPCLPPSLHSSLHLSLHPCLSFPLYNFIWG